MSELVENTDCRIYSSGQVVVHFYSIQETICPINMARFPFDRQCCDVRITFPTYTMNEVSVLARASSMYSDLHLLKSTIV